MKEILKPIFSWLLGLFNFGVYIGDGIDSLILQLYSLKLENQANEIVHLYETLQWLEVIKTILMLTSLIFLYLANQHTINKFLYWSWTKIKTAYHFLKTKFKQLFKP